MRIMNFMRLCNEYMMQPILKAITHERKFKINTSYCDIHYKCHIPDSTRFFHKGVGVVIGEFVKLGENITIYQHVTIGGIEKKYVNPDFHGNPSPVIEDNVIIMTGASILGNITIGHNSIIGAGAVVVDDIPPYSLVVGIPGKVIKKLDEKDTIN
jgi:serine O-acetyltransferase